jgi:hypothetical protein
MAAFNRLAGWHGLQPDDFTAPLGATDGFATLAIAEFSL